MKIIATVTKAEDVGDALMVTLQGKPPSAPKWYGWKHLVVTIPIYDAARRTYHVGRKVQIEVKPL